jgi:hypothetical protein
MLAGLLCLIGAVQNHILPLFLRRGSVDIEGHKKSYHSQLIASIKRHLLLPATFGNSHIRRPYFLSIPLRSQTLLISIYLIINLIFMCVDYEIFENNLYWPQEEPIQLTRYVADRSGILAFSQIPLLIAFAGRNNILIWLTGWSYQTFNVWHKWVARMCFIYTFIHSVAYTVYAFQEGGASVLALYYLDTYLRWGAVVIPFKSSVNSREPLHALFSSSRPFTSSDSSGTKYSSPSTSSLQLFSLSDAGTTSHCSTSGTWSGFTPRLLSGLSTASFGLFGLWF